AVADQPVGLERLEVLGDRGGIELEELGHPHGVGEARQPQSVEDQRAGLGRGGHGGATLLAPDAPSGRGEPRPDGAQRGSRAAQPAEETSPSASWNISYSSPVSAQSSNWMTPSSVNLPRSQPSL